MVETVVRLYDWMAVHRRVCLLSLVLSTIVLLALVLRLDFKEDISDFLPLDSRQQQEMQVYQEVSDASRVFAVFSGASPDSLVESVDRFVEILEARDTAHWVNRLMAEADLSQAGQTVQFVYDNIPFFLLPDDYRRMDSLLQADNYIARQLQSDREMLMSPAGGLLWENIQRDPLNLFAPALTSLRQTSGGLFKIYEDHLFTPDMSRAIVMLDSSFGSSETDGNARLLSLLQVCADSLVRTPVSPSPRRPAPPSLRITFTGGPAIAVGNARQIRADSVLSISLAVVLILLLLWLSFRSIRHLLLIVVAVGWGWLFALGVLSLVHSQVSLIVIGISSVIVGIAVNYPLHLISHLSHTPDVRQALREIVRPLVVGNVTTVAAFLTLVPMQSVALRDLGLFSAFLLVGTIIFVLLWMPHAVKRGNGFPARSLSPALSLSRLSSISLHDKPWLVGLVLVMTLFLGYYSVQTSFDTDLNHINYMTDEQRADMAALAPDRSEDPANPRFLLSDSIQQLRLERWRDWVGEHRTAILDGLQMEAVRAGFTDGAFDVFAKILTADYQSRPLLHFRQLPPNLLVQNIDAKGLNSSLLRQLSDNFNYIGWACGCIVFFFLWFSFRSLFLAALSFLPMAVSWVWILGIMALCGIQFNIVNVILATFIFGQGDDYTIFMTEGAVYEAVHRRRMLASYKRAIILSALIMFIGIGSLIVARHPALHSLAEVTIVGMSSVVLMAFIFPPLIFGLYVRWRRGKNN